MTWQILLLAVIAFLLQSLVVLRFVPCGSDCPSRKLQPSFSHADDLRIQVARTTVELQTLRNLQRQHQQAVDAFVAMTSKPSPRPELPVLPESPVLPLRTTPAPSILVERSSKWEGFRSSPEITTGVKNAQALPATHDMPVANLFIPKSAAADGAVCLDGTPAGYYIRPGQGRNATKWVLFLEGGGWCYSNITCIERRTRWFSMGSMKSRAKKFILKHGFGSPDPHTNPDFHDWTHVFFIYCDGSSFTSNQEDPIYLPAPLWNNSMVALYFRGHRVLQTTLHSLFEDQDLGQATEVMLAGHSAGAMAVLIHANAIRARFPNHTRVFGVVDAGLFIDYCNATVYARSHCHFMKDALRFWNASGLSTECLENEPEAWRCLFPSYILPYVKVPLFMVQHLYDNWAIKNLLGLKWVSYNNRLERHQLDMITAFGKQLEAAVAPQNRSSQGGLFLSRCELGVHGELLMHHWGQHFIQGATPQMALHEWYAGSCRHKNGCKWIEGCDWPEEYGRNMTLVEQGVLDACLLQAGRREVGFVQQFRLQGQCPASAKFVLQRSGSNFTWVPMGQHHT